MSQFRNNTAALIGLLALAGCASGAAPAVGAASQGQTGLPHVDHQSVAAGVMEKFHPEMSEYLTEIQNDNDYGNWRAPPATAFNQ